MILPTGFTPRIHWSHGPRVPSFSLRAIFNALTYPSNIGSHPVFQCNSEDASPFYFDATAVFSLLQEPLQRSYSSDLKYLANLAADRPVIQWLWATEYFPLWA